jgi:hypothetical protein
MQNLDSNERFVNGVLTSVADPCNQCKENAGHTIFSL